MHFIQYASLFACQMLFWFQRWGANQCEVSVEETELMEPMCESLLSVLSYGGKSRAEGAKTEKSKLCSKHVSND